MSQVDIGDALLAKLNTIADASWPTKWENSPQPSLSTAQTGFQSVHLHFATVDQDTINREGTRVVRGILQVNLFVRPNTGTEAAQTRADAIIAEFQRADNPTNGTSAPIIDKVEVMSSYEDNGIDSMSAKWFITPVLIKFFAFE